MRTNYRSCPFCGSTEIYGKMESINEWANYFVIHCDGCGAFVTFCNDQDKCIADIENRYNRRAGDDL